LVLPAERRRDSRIESEESQIPLRHLDVETAPGLRGAESGPWLDSRDCLISGYVQKMNHEIISITQLNADQINALAKLHHEVMHSLLTDLGLPFLERYYQIAGGDSSVIGFCAMSEMGSPLGWAIGSPRPDQLNRRLREAPLWFASQMLRVLLNRPRLIWQLLISAQSASAQLADGSIELTYIGVDHSARQQGLGRELLNIFIQAAHDSKYRSVTLSVEAENERAIALYTKAGFRAINSFTEGSFKRLRMELKL